jgi:predicted phage terminase large subunit-like protein
MSGTQGNTNSSSSNDGSGFDQRLYQLSNILQQRIRLNKYIKIKPSPRQALFLMLNAREALYGGAAGGGKAASLDTPIPTSDGWKTMGTIRPGDKVFTPIGTLTEVLACSEVMYERPCYELIFSDSSTIVVDAAHNWYTWTLKERTAAIRRTDEYREKRRSIRPSRGTGKRPDLAARNKIQTPKLKLLDGDGGSVKTTQQIAETLITKNRQNHSLPDVSAITELPYTNLGLDPYILGLWLGDGCSNSSQIIIGDDDKEEITQAFSAEKYVYSVPGLITRLKSIGLGFINTAENAKRYDGAKFIPPEYLRASLEQRLALLQGLMDTDGTVNADGQCEFSSSLPALSYGLAELIFTLGGRATVRRGTAKLYGEKKQDRYRVKFVLPFPAFRLERKLIKQNKRQAEKLRVPRYIVAAKPVESVPVRCIQVADPSGMFLIGKTFIPTHNSSALLAAALQYVDIPGYSALLLRRNYSDLEMPGALMHKAKEWLSDTDARSVDGGKKWYFPSGASLMFGYLDSDQAKYKYASAEFQFCTVAGTPVLMADGRYKSVESLQIGDEVQTLSGARKITRKMPARLAECVQADIINAKGEKVASQVHTLNHRVLTPDGTWVSYLDMYDAVHLSGTSFARQNRFVRKPFSLPEPKYPFVSQRFSHLSGRFERLQTPVLPRQGQSGHAVSAVLSKDGQNDYVGFDGSRLTPEQLPTLSYPVQLAKPVLPSIQSSFQRYDDLCGQTATLTSNFQDGYRFSHDLCDGQFLPLQVCDPTHLASQVGVVAPNNNVGSNHSTFLPECDHYQKAVYVHPYTGEIRYSKLPVESGALVCSPVGKKLVYDITVDAESHYITKGGTISVNCGFDELTQFCLVPATEVLTERDGWIPITHVAKGQNVLSLNLQNRKVTWEKVTATPSFDYEGKLHHLDSQYVEYVATPNHKFVISKQDPYHSGRFKLDLCEVRKFPEVVSFPLRGDRSGNFDLADITNTSSPSVVQEVLQSLTRHAGNRIGSNPVPVLAEYHTTLEDYKGKVYCLTVENNHTFLARYNGKVFWSGNSQPQYTFLFSRLRKNKGVNVPLRMRGASNPGGYGHKWVYQRFFVEGKKAGRIFVPALMRDNPYLNHAEYDKGLMELDPVTRRQLQLGDWLVADKGNRFQKEWFEVLDYIPSGIQYFVRYWDLAATEANLKNTDPDYTAGALLGFKEGIYYLLEMQRFRATPANVEARIKSLAERDGRQVPVFFEQEGGATGKSLISHYQRNVLPGWAVYGIPPSGSKEVRALPASAAAESGNLKVIRGDWLTEFFDELEMFPKKGYGIHDDQVDALSGAMNALFELFQGNEFDAKWGGANKTLITTAATPYVHVPDDNIIRYNGLEHAPSPYSQFPSTFNHNPYNPSYVDYLPSDGESEYTDEDGVTYQIIRPVPNQVIRPPGH